MMSTRIPLAGSEAMRRLRSLMLFVRADALNLLLRLALGSLFLYAGTVKALHPSNAVLAVHGYALGPGFLLRPAALGITLLEITFGSLLLTGLFTRFAAWGTAALATVFLVVLIQAKIRGLHISCGCFGGNGAGGGVSWFDFVREPPMLAAGAYLARCPITVWRLHPVVAKTEERLRATRVAEQVRRLMPAAILVTIVALALLVPTLGGASRLTLAAASEGVTIDGPARSSTIPVGSKLPDFSAHALDGGTISLAAQSGTPVVLVLWAPWCPDCRKELPTLAKVVSEFPNVRLIGIATAVGGAPGPTPAQFMRDLHLVFPVALDTADGRLLDGFGVERFPTVYYVKANGRVLRVTVGPALEDQMRSFAQAIAA
jgi:thiol-disulfide isomerase/thioredoxin/uncharacterized membrane protein YphA (DoxX/SURF4 family)